MEPQALFLHTPLPPTPCDEDCFQKQMFLMRAQTRPLEVTGKPCHPGSHGQASTPYPPNPHPTPPHFRKQELPSE